MNKPAKMTEHPLSLLYEAAQFIAWQHSVGTDEAKEKIDAAARRHIVKHGPRSALDIVDKMDDVVAYIQEREP